MLKLLFIISLLWLNHAGQIRSDQISVNYNMNGIPMSYTLPFWLTNNLATTDYFKISWPFQLYTTTKSSLYVVLQSQIGDTIAASYVVVDLSLNPTLYFVTFNTNLYNSTWYRLKIYGTGTAVSTGLVGLVQLQTTSYHSNSYITYDRNMAFGYLYIQQPLSGAAAGTLTITVTPFSLSNSYVAAEVYNTFIDITPSYSSSSGGNFTVAIYINSPLLTGSTNLPDFSFVGLCQADIPTTCLNSPCTIPQLNYCNIDSSLSYFTFSINSFTSGYPIRIKTTVYNPVYASVRGLSAYYVDLVTGIVKQNAILVTAFTVNSITINNLLTDRVYLHWGMQNGYTDSNIAGVNIGVYTAAATQRLGPLNSFNIGFSIQATSPINAIFTVLLNIGAAGVLEGSIVHNLPAATNKQVYCFYSTPNVVCNNVGALVNVSFRYFISGKAYYTVAAPSNITNFGDVTIQSVVYDVNGNLISGVNLFTPLVTNNNVTVSQNYEYLDTTGVHSTSYGMRNTQIVSFLDDGTKNSTGNAVYGVWNNINTTVGIMPNLGTSQQLLFFLNVPTLAMSISGNPSNVFEMKILYNSQVIGFQNGTSSYGLDFVGYSATNKNWSIYYFPAYQNGTVVTQKYADNITTQTINTQTVSSAGNYGLYDFKCGQSTLFSAATASTLCGAPGCVQYCNMFQGFTGADTSGGVISMRKVTFPSNYFHSSLYADSNLLDFIITFSHGGNTVSSSLINAYTIEPFPMQNIKAAYVNYYDSAGVYNKGVKIPMMVRIGGGVLVNESRGADTVAVFFDQNVVATTFLSSAGQSYSIGCSTASCVYYPNLNVISPQDIWHSCDRVEFSNIPPLMNQFNLLVPIVQTSGTTPSSLTIAFLKRNYTLSGVNGLLTVLSVYRLFGPPVRASILAPISSINSLAPSITAGTLNIDFTPTVWFDSTVTTSLGYYLNTNNIMNSPPNNTIYSGSTGTAFTVSSTYGAGITITSFNFNIFGSLYIRAFSNVSCATFSYLYTEITAGANPDRTGKFMYVAYCPIDSSLDLSTSLADVIFNNPNYPSVFVSGFPLQTVLAYGLSNPYGRLIGYKLQTGTISYSQNCTTTKITPYYPNSAGLQRATYSIYHNSILMAATPNGYPSIQVLLTMPSATVLTNSLIISNSLCDVSISSLSCAVTSSTSTTALLTLSLSTATSISLSSYTINIYGTSSASFGTVNNYTITISLPQYGSTSYLLYGSSYTSKTQFASCSSIFTVSSTAYVSTMSLQNLTLGSGGAKVQADQSFYFNFSPRDAIYSTSTVKLNMGFLKSNNTNRNLACVVYQSTNGYITLSSLWKYMDFTSYPTVVLTPKSQIAQPDSYNFIFSCTATVMPDNSLSTPISSQLIDMTSVVVQASNPNITSVTQVATSQFSSISLLYKRFNTMGMLAYYTFAVYLESAITSAARFYISFPYSIGSAFNSDNQFECYLRSADNPSTNDVTSLQAYCYLDDDRRITILNNLALALGSNIYIDVFQVAQPKSSDITATSYIGITLDLDSNLGNGVFRYSQILDTAPSSTLPTNLVISALSISPSYLRTNQTIIVTFTMPISTVSVIYFQLPAPYYVWNQRGVMLSSSSCILALSSTPSVNIASACQFISQRVIKITVSSISVSSYILTLYNITSPLAVSMQYQSMVHFNMYLSDTLQSFVTYYSTQVLVTSTVLSLNSSSSNVDWYINNTLLSISRTPIVIYYGYYCNQVTLQTASNLKSTFNFSITNYNANIQFTSYTANLGYSTQSYKIAATSLASPTLYNLIFNKSGDSYGYYTVPTPLQVVVSSTLCTLSAVQSSYTIPLGGITLPIIINSSNCIPTSSISVSLIFYSYSSELAAQPDLSNTALTSDSLDGRIYFVVKHSLGMNLVAGVNVTVGFNISGTCAAYYNPIPNITLMAVTSSSIVVPASTVINGPYLNANQGSFVMRCSAPSTIYWGIGLYPSTLNMTALDFQARLISANTGLVTNFSESYDSYGRVYGIQYNSVQNKQINQTVTNLRSNSYYQFKYFCINQNSVASQAQTLNFYSTNTNANLLKILFTFNNSLNYQQINALACTLAENFVIPYARILTSSISSCNVNSTVFYPNGTTTLIEPINNLTGYYIYNVYIVPDYTVSYDYTNNNITTLMSNPQFSTSLLLSTMYSSTFPYLVQMQSQILYSSSITPVIVLVSIQPTTQGALLTAYLNNTNGYIVAAAMQGFFANSNTSLPTTVNIKNGIFYNNTLLNAVYMQYTSQYNSITINMSTLLSNTNYTLYYFGTIDDPEYSAAASAVGYLEITTLQQSVIVVDYEQSLLIGIILLVIIVMA